MRTVLIGHCVSLLVVRSLGTNTGFLSKTRFAGLNLFLPPPPFGLVVTPLMGLDTVSRMGAGVVSAASHYGTLS